MFDCLEVRVLGMLSPVESDLLGLERTEFGNGQVNTPSFIQCRCFLGIFV